MSDNQNSSVESVVVENGIPIPPVRERKVRLTDEMRNISPGGSVLFSEALNGFDWREDAAAFYQWLRSRGWGSVRRKEGDGVRVWRSIDGIGSVVENGGVK